MDSAASLLFTAMADRIEELTQRVDALQNALCDLAGVPTPSARPNRNAYQRDYMRKWRAAKKAAEPDDAVH